ncbi:MAG TPA: hypothetical protein ENI07_20510 [Desulfobacterales bacterium]|nr:hypothetical protein [Desulfobacterales bacterium]
MRTLPLIVTFIRYALESNGCVKGDVGAFDALISNLFGADYADYAVFYCLLNPENRIQKTHNPTGKEKQGDRGMGSNLDQRII